MTSPTNDYAIVIAGHGSRDPEGISEFEQLANLVRQRAGERQIQHGFLEFARPTIDEAARSLITTGTLLAIGPPGHDFDLVQRLVTQD